MFQRSRGNGAQVSRLCISLYMDIIDYGMLIAIWRLSSWKEISSFDYLEKSIFRDKNHSKLVVLSIQHYSMTDWRDVLTPSNRLYAIQQPQHKSQGFDASTRENRGYIVDGMNIQNDIYSAIQYHQYVRYALVYYFFMLSLSCHLPFVFICDAIWRLCCLLFRRANGREGEMGVITRRQ